VNLATLLHRQIRASDLSVRYGGEENGDSQARKSSINCANPSG
jgi:GGDEF domain-containing protein